jgi:hypothetical protein
MKITSRYFKLLSIFLTLSFVGGQSIIANQPNVDVPQQPGEFEYAILAPSKFQMNQGFTLMTSMGSGMSQTTGIYSNFSSYKLSERMLVKTGIHLIQNQDNLSYSTGPQAGVGYEIGLEYKLSPNSLITFQVANYSNSPIRYRNLSPFNVP